MKQEQLEHLYEIGNKETKKYLETELNYKRPFKVGDFIASKSLPKFFGLITEIKKSTFYYEGFDGDGFFVSLEDFGFDDFDYHPTKEEIEQHLIKVAELKGYKEGVEVSSLVDGYSDILTSKYYFLGGDLWVNCNNFNILLWRKSENKWASIIEPKKWSYEYDKEECSFALLHGRVFCRGYIGNKSLAEKICNLLNSEQ